MGECAAATKNISNCAVTTVAAKTVLKCELEAITNQSHALKHKLVSVSNPNLLRLPNLELSGDSNVNSTDSVITLGRNLQKTAVVQLQQQISSPEKRRFCCKACDQHFPTRHCEERRAGRCVQRVKLLT
jgi:hypothetical protein